MEAILSSILDKIETIDDLIDKGDPDDLQEVVDDLWDLVHDEMHQDWIKSVMEVT
jgi:hypothetical protein